MTLESNGRHLVLCLVMTGSPIMSAVAVFICRLTLIKQPITVSLRLRGCFCAR